MKNTTHEHIFIREGKYLICSCGKKKLFLEKDNNNNNIYIGERGDGKAYTVREDKSRIFLPDEWKTFYDCLKLQQRFTFYILLNTGARINEARHIKIEDIDFKNQRIVLRVTKHKKADVHKSHMRTLRVSTKCIREIRKHINDFHLSSNDYIKILSTPAANLAMEKALNKTKIKDKELFTIQSIRKTSETWCLALGIDSMLLSKRFGHNLMTMYQHYSQSDAFSYNEKDFIKEFFDDTFID